LDAAAAVWLVLLLAAGIEDHIGWAKPLCPCGCGRPYDKHVTPRRLS
jgi:hypothetical protein